MNPRELREALASYTQAEELRAALEAVPKDQWAIRAIQHAARAVALPILEGRPEVREAIKAHWYAATPETMVEAILRELAALIDTEKE